MNAQASNPCVLIVEDEMCLAMMLEDILMDAGYDVRKAARLPAALQLVQNEPFDVAILDINLAGKEVCPVADALSHLGVPFLFTSGYGHNGVPAEYRQRPMLQKPYNVEYLQQTLSALLQARA